MKQLILFFGLTLSVAACSKIPPSAYQTRGQPESLLDVSAEIVNMDVSNSSAVDDLVQWVNDDQPSRAELYCPLESPSCLAAQDVLDLYGIPSTQIPSDEQMVTLVYERVLARDCENRFIDNTINPYNLPHASHGCSVAVNMVQMISDKQQLVRPNLLDQPDAKKTGQSYLNYLTRRQIQQNQQGINNSLLQQARNQ